MQGTVLALVVRQQNANLCERWGWARRSQSTIQHLKKNPNDQEVCPTLDPAYLSPNPTPFIFLRILAYLVMHDSAQVSIIPFRILVYLAIYDSEKVSTLLQRADREIGRWLRRESEQRFQAGVGHAVSLTIQQK